jgi:hypothetical protein
VKPESASDTIYVEKDNVVVWSGQWSGTGGYPSLNWIFSQKGDGEYVFYLCDSHCNQSSKITLEVDGTKPTIQDITITENPTSENSIVVSGTIFDEHFNSYKCRIYSGDKIVNLSNSIGEWPGGTANVADGELCVMNIGVLLDGDYYVRVYADDTVGNNNNDGSLYFPFTIARATTPSIPTTPVTPVVPTNPSTPAASATPASSPVVAASTASYSSVVGGTNYAGTTTGDETNDDSEVASTTATSPSNPLQDTGEILGAQDRQDWSLINLILTVATVVVGVAAAIAHFVRRRGEESNRSVAVVIGGLAAVGAAIAFFLTENTALPVVWFDQWTLLMVGLALVSVITTAVALRKSSGK